MPEVSNKTGHRTEWKKRHTHTHTRTREKGDERRWWVASIDEISYRTIDEERTTNDDDHADESSTRQNLIKAIPYELIENVQSVMPGTGCCYYTLYVWKHHVMVILEHSVHFRLWRLRFYSTCLYSIPLRFYCYYYYYFCFPRYFWIR